MSCENLTRYMMHRLSRGPLDNIRVMVIVWRLRGNIIRTAPCWIVWHNVHSQQHTYVSSSYRSNELGLSHWDPYAVRRGGCLELYYWNMVKWFWWDSSLIFTTNWFPSVLWHCWFGHLTCKIAPEMTYYVSSWTLKPAYSPPTTRNAHSLHAVVCRLHTTVKCRLHASLVGPRLYTLLIHCRLSCFVWRNIFMYCCHTTSSEF